MNRSAFFASVKTSLFQGRLGTKQVEGMDLLLDTQQRYFPKMPEDELAVVLATVYHETGATMQPIKERGGDAYFTRMYDIRGSRPKKAIELGNVNPGDGKKFPGMGFVQSTGRGNARKARGIIKEMLGEDVDFEKNPTKLMDPRYSSILTFYGMVHGTYTGKKLSDYIDGDGEEDPGEFVNSRRIINGRDRAQMIAGYARDFLAALHAAREITTDLGRQTTGKTLLESKTSMGAIVGASASVIPAAKEIVTHAQDAVATAHDAAGVVTDSWDLIVKVGPWVLLLVVIIGAAAMIITERHKKSVELGI